MGAGGALWTFNATYPPLSALSLAQSGYRVGSRPSWGCLGRGAAVGREMFPLALG